MLAELTKEQRSAIGRRLSGGLSTFSSPQHMTLEEWSASHFYLSAESSYVEQRWRSWPYQRAIMACISNDDIREINWPKAARTGNTKIMLASICYFAAHKRRNQAMWQPTDDDRTEFVKTELDPAIRDISAMQRVFPAYLARHKDNTLQQKTFLGSILHLRGGKSAKNYRRISVDVGYMDEVDAFDRDVESEGDPFSLAEKRVEGATFPKMIIGSTPKTRGFSLIEDRTALAHSRFEFVIPCPECGELHPITWGGKAEHHGLKWFVSDGVPDPESVRHLCPHCGALIQQGDYLRTYHAGQYRSDDGKIMLDNSGKFTDTNGRTVPTPAHIAFVGVWTAYSPAASWPKIVRDFLAASDRMKRGDLSLMKSFTNTTLGRSWEEKLEKTDVDTIQSRAEAYQLRSVPDGAVLLLASVDTQDDRLECTIRGYGRGCETWTICHDVLYGKPSDDAVWTALEDLIFDTDFRTSGGSALRVHATAIDSGGHFTQAVYSFAKKHARRRVFAVKGASGQEKHIQNGAQKVDIDWRGRLEKRGLIIWHVGTNLAKDLLHSRMALQNHGPGYMHHPQYLPDEWFAQLTGEARAERVGTWGRETRWIAQRKRVEAWDCAVYCLWLETHLGLQNKPNRFWEILESRIEVNPEAKHSVPEMSPGNVPSTIPREEVQQRPVARRFGRIGKF
jgi:terminase, large subunit